MSGFMLKCTLPVAPPFGVVCARVSTICESSSATV
jgi:hypothetical protein